MISRVALAQIARDGWSGTTMAAIAERSGVSEPTLFRYFPTKADVLWHGMDESARVFRERFDQRDRTAPGPLAVVDAYREMLLSDAERLSLIKVRAAIIAGDAAAAEASWPKFEEWRSLVTDLLRHVDPAASADELRIRGAMIWAALWSALTTWSLDLDPDPSTRIAVARRLVASIG